MRIDLSRRTVLKPDDSPAALLADIEFALLLMLADNMDSIVNHEALKSAVTGIEPSDMPTRAIETCMNRLRLKLRTAGVEARIWSAREAGYMLCLHRKGSYAQSNR